MCILGFCVKLPYPLGFPINRGGGAALHTHPLLSYTCHALSGSLYSLPRKEFRRAVRLSGFRQELVLDGEALPDR